MLEIKKYNLIVLAMILLIVAGCSSKEYDEAMEKGKEAINDEDYEEAVMFFKKAVDEKEDDKKAKSYLKQSDKMIAGLSSFEGGEFNSAKDDFDVILKEDDAILHKQAEEQINKIEEIEGTYDEVTTSYEDAEKHLNDEEYKKALTLIDKLLDKDLTHAYLKKPKEDLQELKETVQDEQTKMQDLRSEAKETYDKADNLGDDGNYDKALSIIGDILDKDLNHPKLTSIKKDLESLQEDFKEKSEEKRLKEKNKAKKAQLKNEFLATFDEFERQAQKEIELSYSEDESGSFASTHPLIIEKADQWDAYMNEVYQILKEDLSDSEFANLKENQKSWLQNKDNSLDEATTGGTAASEAKAWIEYDETKNRSYYLVENYFD